jgi:Asp-tRNA(Asn)/Glu-tRNA(Gln) amidotransferase A subunit family amidase
MYTHAAPLSETVDALRSNRRALPAYIDAICDRFDEVEPHVHAFLPEEDLRARLHADAEALAARYPHPADRPPLYGALAGIKDIIHVDGFVTRAGAQVPPERLAGPEAEVVRRLRAAGALMAGKTVTTEFAYFEPGPTRNPHNLEHTPGGSSSGSAAAVAAGMATLAVGTQTIGSVIRPAAFCGVVGFKPTYGRLPMDGVLYFSRSVDHLGLFTQEASGMTLAASALCNGWRLDRDVDSLPVLGVPDGPYLAQTEPDALAAFEATVDDLKAAGVIVRRVLTLRDIDELNILHRRLAFGEFAREHAAIFAEYEDRLRPRTLEIVEIGRSVSDKELKKLRANRARLRQDLKSQMSAAGIDLWACPPAPGPAPAGIHATGDPNMNLPWTHAGLPALTLPAGVAENGLPLGLQLVGRFGEDERLLAWGEQLTELGALSQY